MSPASPSATRREFLRTVLVGGLVGGLAALSGCSSRPDTKTTAPTATTGTVTPTATADATASPSRTSTTRPDPTAVPTDTETPAETTEACSVAFRTTTVTPLSGAASAVEFPDPPAELTRESAVAYATAYERARWDQDIRQRFDHPMDALDVRIEDVETRREAGGFVVGFLVSYTARLDPGPRSSATVENEFRIGYYLDGRVVRREVDDPEGTPENPRTEGRTVACWP